MSTSYEYHSTSSSTKTPVTTTYNSQTHQQNQPSHQRLHQSQDDLYVRPVMASRNIVVNRQSGGYGPVPYGRMYSAQMKMVPVGLPVGSYANITATGVTAVKESREKEKKDMQGLNERFANYLEKVRFLEAQNKTLADELAKLKARWGKETSQIKSMFTAELDEARKLLDDAIKDKARLEIKVASLEDEAANLKRRLNETQKSLVEGNEMIDRLSRALSEVESEIGLLRRRNALLETQREKDRQQIVELQDAMTRMRMDLDNETLLHIDAESRRQTLEEELEFLKSVHEQELKELAALAYRDTTAENRDFWRNEMGQALREIQQMYDDKIDSMKNEMEASYNLKIQEFRSGANRQNVETVQSKEEIKRLKTFLKDSRDKLAELEEKCGRLLRELEELKQEKEQRERELETENDELRRSLARIRAEMEATMKELQEIMDSKLGLELEIAAYRKLLEGEEHRVGLKTIVDGWMSGAPRDQSNTQAVADPLRMSQVIKGEISAKTTYQRSAKGPCAIAECAADGKFIAIENTGRKEENLGGWRVKRNVDGIDKVEFILDRNLTIKPLGKVKIWVQGAKPFSAPLSDVEVNLLNWGVGANIITMLLSSAGEGIRNGDQALLLHTLHSTGINLYGPGLLKADDDINLLCMEHLPGYAAVLSAWVNRDGVVRQKMEDKWWA